MDKDAAGKRVQIKEESEQSSNGYKTGTDLLDKQGRLGESPIRLSRLLF
jgi:hypothetical protein